MTPSSEATVLFADVIGSSTLYQQAGARKTAAVIHKCLAALRAAAEASDGRVVKTIGDELMALFPNPNRAAVAATRMHLALSALPPVHGQKLSLRIGFHAGPVVQRNGDVFGDTVNVASRLTAQATRGQVLTSAQTVTKLATPLRSSTRRLYEITMKGKAEDVSLCELLWSKSADVTDLPAEHVRKSRIPSQLRLRLGRRELTYRRLAAPITIGRDPASTLVVAASTASRHHCVIERRQHHFVLKDQSSNGTVIAFEGEADTVLRREELVLHGHGWITFGQARAATDDIVEYFCDEDPAENAP